MYTDLDRLEMSLLRYEFRGARVAYERRGEGPGIVFLHNGGTSGRIWRPQVKALSESHETIVVDLPGFGASELPSPAITLDGYIDLIESMIEDLSVGPVVLVGNCMGSNIAAGLAMRRPEVVHALVLVNPLTEATFSAGWLGALHRMYRLSPAVTGAFRSVARRMRIPRPVAGFALRFQFGPAGSASRLDRDPELLACNVRRDQLPGLIDVLDDMSAYGALDRARLPEGLPVMTIWGSRNRVLSADSGRILNSSIGVERELTIADCGHLPMLEQPDMVTDAIREFLSVASRSRS